MATNITPEKIAFAKTAFGGDQKKSGITDEKIAFAKDVGFDNTEEKVSLVNEPENRTMSESMLKGTSVDSRNPIDMVKDQDISLTGLATRPQQYLTEFLGKSPAISAGSEGLRREEAVFANALRTGYKGGNVTDILKAAGRGAMGTELNEFGNFYKEELGLNDLAAASAGYLTSMFLPSNLMGAKKFKSPKTKVDSFLTRPTGGKGAASEIISKATGVQRESVETVLTEGPKKVLRKEFSSEMIPRDAAIQIKDGLNGMVKSAGEEVGRIKGELSLGGKKVITKRIKDEFLRIKEKYGLDKAKKGSALSSLSDDVNDLDMFVDHWFKGDSSVDNLLLARDELGDLAYNGFKRGGEKEIVKPLSKTQAAMREFRHSISDQLHSIAPELADADKAFMSARNLQEVGAKWFDDVSRGEKFLKAIDRPAVAANDKIILRDMMRKVTGTDDLLKKIRFHLAQKGFEDLIPAGLAQRVFGGTAVAGTAASVAFGNPMLAIPTTAIAAATSPKAIGHLLKMGESSAGLVESLIKRTKSASSRKALMEITK